MTKIYQPISEIDVIKSYNTKIIKMGNHIEIIKYDKEIDYIPKHYEKSETTTKKQIIRKIQDDINTEPRSDNISRTRNKMKQIVLTNEHEWKSFITLTFKGTPTNQEAELYYKNYMRQVKRKYPDFKALTVIELQDRGIPHYHLLTNLKCGSELIPKRESITTYNNKKNKKAVIEYYNLKYWSYGYSSAFDITMTDDNFNVLLYMLPYISKNNKPLPKGTKLFRYTRNLQEPVIEKIILTEQEHLEMIKNHVFNHTKIITPNRKYAIPYTITTIQTDRQSEKSDI